MGAMAIQQMSDRLAALMEERLRIRGAGLEAKLTKGGRMLPRHVRAAAGRLAEAATMAQNPKLYLTVDQQKVASDYDLCLRHLSGLNLWDRRKAMVLNWLASTVFTLAVVGALVFAVLRWRGLV